MFFGKCAALLLGVLFLLSPLWGDEAQSSDDEMPNTTITLTIVPAASGDDLMPAVTEGLTEAVIVQGHIMILPRLKTKNGDMVLVPQEIWQSVIKDYISHRLQDPEFASSRSAKK